MLGRERVPIQRKPVLWGTGRSAKAVESPLGNLVRIILEDEGYLVEGG